MNSKQRQATAMMALLCTIGVTAQVLNNGTGDYRLTSGGNIPRSFTVGGTFSPVGFMSALTVRGDQMGGTSVTPEVFRTNAPTTGATYWRMFQGGTAGGDERGQLFADPSSTHFNINAPQGHLRLLTNTTERARINASGSYTIGSFTGQVASGFLGVSPNSTLWTGGNPGPFSRLHLHDGTSVQSASYRPWMKNGVTFTGNQDHSFLGQKSAAVDYTDMVLHWSDNPGVTLKDRLRFIFTSGYSSIATSGAQSTEGLEAMRIFPARYEEAYIGFGDFYAANLANPLISEPTERVDMVNGRLRIRDLPNDPMAIDSFYVMVVDRTALTAANQERGVVKWVPPSVFGGGGGADCKWTLLGTGNANIATAYPSNPGCPQYDRFVGIGTNAPAAKLHVKWTGTSGDAHAGQFEIDGSSYGKRGGEFNASGTGSLHAGLRAIASGASSGLNLEGNFGVQARADATVSVSRNRGAQGEAKTIGSVTVAKNIGVDAIANCQPTGAITENYGILASTNNQAATTQDYAGRFVASATNAATVYGIRASATGSAAVWAGWFDGDVTITGNGFVNGTIPITSDGLFKTDVQEVTGALDLVAQLRPRSYVFNDLGTSVMGLPDGRHMGFIAQELQEVLPDLVHETLRPAEVNDEGNIVTDALPYKAVDYIGVIPLLVAAMQEQQQQIAQLSEQLAACCSNPDTDQRTAPAQGNGNDQGALNPVQDRLLRIAPNPFTERTTLYCTLERSGRMQLLANSADGRDLRVLSEAQREAGEYLYEWDTTALAPGVYYITLLLDGEPVVKKAVKVGR